MIIYGIILDLRQNTCFINCVKLLNEKDSIVNIENRTGKSIMDITNSLGANNYSMKDIVIVMHEALQGAGGKFIQSAVGDMLMQTGMSKGAVLCSEVLMTLFTGEKKEEDSPLVQGENEQKDTQSSNT